MKRNKLILMAVMAITVFSSCLKDKFDILNPDNSAPVVEFRNPGFTNPAAPDGSLYTIFSVAMTTGALVEQTYEVALTGPDPAPQDITVTIGSKTSAVDEFNVDKKKGNPAYPAFDLLESNLVTILTPSVTIPKGQRTATVKVGFKTNDFSFVKKYAFPLTITSTSYATVSKNFGTILLNTVAKNQYDGVYAMQAGSFVQRYTAPGVPTVNDALNGNTSTNPAVSLVTIDANTVEITNLRWAGGASGVAGIDNLRARVDPATNLVTMFSIGGPTLANKIGTVNKYDPATKTFTLHFDWAQTGAAREYALNIKYTGSR